MEPMVVFGASLQVSKQPGVRIDLPQLERGQYALHHSGQLARPPGTGAIETLTPHHRPTLITFGRRRCCPWAPMGI